MKITQDEVADNQTTLHIELEEEDLSPYLDMGYQRIAHQVSIPGFRKGKAPRRVVEGFVGRDRLLNEAMDDMIPEIVDKAIDERDLDLVGSPRVEEVRLDPVQFSAVVPLRPEIDLGDYRSIRLDYEKPEITEEQVSERLEAIRQSLGNWETVDRAARLDDMVMLDVASDLSGRDIWGMKDRFFFLADDGTYPLPGFSEQVVDLAAGDRKEFSLKVPEDSDSHILAKEAFFDITVKDVKERVLPELNDEFAQGLPDGYETLDALRTAVEESMAADAEEQSKIEYRNSVIGALVEGASLTIPPAILESEVERMREERGQALRNANVRMDDYLAAEGKTLDDLNSETESEAERTVRRNFVVDKLADTQGVEATEEETDELFAKLYSGQRMRRQERREHRMSLVNMIRYQKAVDDLVEMAMEKSDEADEPQDQPTEPAIQDSEGGGAEDDSRA